MKKNNLYLLLILLLSLCLSLGFTFKKLENTAIAAVFEVAGYMDDQSKEPIASMFFECLIDDSAKTDLEAATEASLSQVIWEREGKLITKFTTRLVTDEKTLNAYYSAKKKSADSTPTENEILIETIERLNDQISKLENDIKLLTFENGNLKRQNKSLAE